MHFSKLFFAAAIASVVAQPIQHAHHVHKRDPDVALVTVLVTQYVDADGSVATGVNDGPVETASVPAAVASAASTASYSVPAQQQSNTAATETAAYTPTTLSTAVASTAGSSGSSDPSAGGAGAGGAKGIVYSPYTSDGQCKSAEQVASDLSQLTGFPLVRIYGVDCNQVPNVLAALSSGQQVFVGVFDTSALDSALSTINDAVQPYGWGIVHTVSIGNELVNSGSASVDQVVSWTNSARATLRGYGYTGPVVAVDTFIAVINNPGLCAASDYMAVNAHAYFDGNVLPENAGDWAVQQTQRVWTACGGSKSVLISECGWPSQGDTNGVAVASPDAQASAISSIKSAISGDVILFTAYNDLWKAPGYLNVEQYWGLFSD